MQLSPRTDGVLIVNDSYTANPDSMRAALTTVAAMRRPGGRLIAVLGDMLELGPDEIALHEAVARLPAMAKVDLVHCVGPRMRALWQGRAAPSGAMVRNTAPQPFMHAFGRLAW